MCPPGSFQIGPASLLLSTVSFEEPIYRHHSHYMLLSSGCGYNFLAVTDLWAQPPFAWVDISAHDNSLYLSTEAMVARNYLSGRHHRNAYIPNKTIKHALSQRMVVSTVSVVVTESNCLSFSGHNHNLHVWFNAFIKS